MDQIQPVRKSQVNKFSWFIRKSQIRKFLQNTAQLYLKTVLKGIVQPFELGGETRLIRSAVK
jgi:hypothetical protein